MSKSLFVFFVVPIAILAIGITPVGAWKLPSDNGTMTREEIAEILVGDDYPETTGYTRNIEFVDFISYGKKFTQVVVRLTPKQLRTRNGKNLMVVGAEAGSEYGMDFLETLEGTEGMGVWLAKRGITFIALTRVGRWNFLAPDGSGSWKSIPLGERMPIFNRDQKTNWSPDDYTFRPATVGSSPTGSEFHRFPKPGSELYNQMLAANPVTLLLGYQEGLNRVLPSTERKKSIVLYWGMSTGGTFLWPLAKYFKPDGYLGWGTSSTGLAALYWIAKEGNFEPPYERAALRVRERGLRDFNFYTRHVPEATKEVWWLNALKNPRFKSVEDPAMFFNAAALTEMAMRLWVADFLPSEYKKAGIAKFISDILEVSFPPKELKNIPNLEINGTLDEVIPPKVVDAYREIMEPYCGKYRVARIQDFHHYLFTQDSIKVVGSLWLRFIESGYFDLGK